MVVETPQKYQNALFLLSTGRSHILKWEYAVSKSYLYNLHQFPHVGYLRFFWFMDALPLLFITLTIWISKWATQTASKKPHWIGSCSKKQPQVPEKMKVNMPITTTWGLKQKHLGPGPRPRGVRPSQHVSVPRPRRRPPMSSCNHHYIMGLIDSYTLW